MSQILKITVAGLVIGFATAPVVADEKAHYRSLVGTDDTVEIYRDTNKENRGDSSRHTVTRSDVKERYRITRIEHSKVEQSKETRGPRRSKGK